MVTKKVFALASATGLAAVVLSAVLPGCSDDDPVTGSTDAGTDRRAPTVVGGEDAAVCYATTPIDATRYGYKDPTVTLGACSDANVDAIVKFVDDTDGATFDDFQKHVATSYPAACNTCIFGAVAATTWSPILLDEKGAVGALNSSGCVQLASGKGNACGAAHWQWNQCIDEACAQCSETQQSACATEVQGGACATATEALATACGNNVNSFITACRGKYGFDAWIRRQCVGLSTDGGVDAGDAGDGGDGGSDAGDGGDGGDGG